MLAQQVKLHGPRAVDRQLHLAANELTVANRPMQSPELLQRPLFDEAPQLEVGLIIGLVAVAWTFALSCGGRSHSGVVVELRNFVDQPLHALLIEMLVDLLLGKSSRQLLSPVDSGSLPQARATSDRNRERFSAYEANSNIQFQAARAWCVVPLLVPAASQASATRRWAGVSRRTGRATGLCRRDRGWSRAAQLVPQQAPPTA